MRHHKVSKSTLIPNVPDSIVEKIFCRLEPSALLASSAVNKVWRRRIQSMRHVLRRLRVMKLEIRAHGEHLLICCWKEYSACEDPEIRWKKDKKTFIAGADFFKHIAYLSPRIASIKGGHLKLSEGLEGIPDWWFRSVVQVTYRPGLRHNIDLRRLLRRCPMVSDLHFKKDPLCQEGYDCMELINSMTSVRRFQSVLSLRILTQIRGGIHTDFDENVYELAKSLQAFQSRMDHVRGSTADDRTLTALVAKSKELRHFIVYELKAKFSLEKIFDVLQHASFSNSHVPFLRFGKLESSRSELIAFINQRSQHICLDPHIMNVYFRFTFKNELYTLTPSEWNWAPHRSPSLSNTDANTSNDTDNENVNS